MITDGKGRKEKRKKGKCKNKYRRGGRKGGILLCYESSFSLTAAWFDAEQPHIISGYIYNITQWVQCNKQKYDPAYYHIKHNKNLIKRPLFQTRVL